MFVRSFCDVCIYHKVESNRRAYERAMTENGNVAVDTFVLFIYLIGRVVVVIEFRSHCTLSSPRDVASCICRAGR